MEGHLTPTIAVNDRNSAWLQQMLGLTGLALGKDLRVLHQLDFGGASGVAFIGKAVQRLRRPLIRLQT